MGTDYAEIITDPVHETTCLKCHHLMDVSSLPAFVEIACPECGTKQHVPAKMGAFLLVELLGKGGMGTVYRGRDTGLDRWVAVKVMQASFGGNPEFVETFRREAQAAAALNHPNVVQIYSFGVAHGQPYMVMELLEGGRLDQMIAKGELLNEALILKIAADVAEGLNAAAAINLIHGDVKPENILLDNNGIAKVVDFGLARFKAKKDEVEGGTSKGIWGTPYYIAPEKLRGHPSDARSDIYSLGGTLFHALALKPPFDGETPLDVVKARLKHPAPPLRSLRPTINHEVEAIVGRMLEAEPQRRYPNYASALSDIRRVLATLKPPTTQPIGQPTKKGGKIVMTTTKKKSGNGTLVTAPVSASLPVPGAEGAVPVKKKKGNGKVVLGVTLALLAMGGAIGGAVAHQNSKKQQSEAAKEKAALKKHVAAADQIWTDLQATLATVSNRDVVARGWASNATQVASLVSTGLTALLPSPNEFESMGSNTLAQSALMTRYVTGVVASVTAELKTLADQVSSNRQIILTTTNAETAHRHLMMITNVPPRSLEVLKPFTDEADKIQKALVGIEQLKKKLDAAVKQFKDDAERLAREKAEADKAAAEQAARDRDAAEKAAKIQGELKTLEESRKNCTALVQQHQFKATLEAVTQAAKGLQTEEGKEAGKHLVKAYGFLDALKTAIIAGVQADVKAAPDRGFQFGWLGSRDILGITDEKVSIRSMGDVAWAAVPPQQMMRFYQRYVDNGDLTRLERAEYNFAIALYIHECTGGAEKSRPQAAKYLSEAVRANSKLGDTAKSVLPNLAIK